MAGFETRSSLLDRLRDPEDSRAWREFDAIYGPLLVRFVRLGGVPEADVEDLVQETLLSVYRSMPGFDYRREVGSFRGYLRQVVRSKTADYWKRRRKPPPHLPIVTEEARPDPGEEIWRREYNTHLLETLLERVRGEIPDQSTWELFRMYILERKTAKEISASTGIPPGTVASRTFRVIERLRAMAREIDPEFWPDL